MPRKLQTEQPINRRRTIDVGYAKDHQIHARWIHEAE
jgi:hypothetical protein